MVWKQYDCALTSPYVCVLIFSVFAETSLKKIGLTWNNRESLKLCHALSTAWLYFSFKDVVFFRASLVTCFNGTTRAAGGGEERPAF